MVSLCLDHGHADAIDYPVGMLLDESVLINERMNSRAANDALLHWMAACTIPNMGSSAAGIRKAQRNFNKAITTLTEGSDGP